VLRELNDALVRHDGDYRFCTALYVGLVPGPRGVAACVSTGGHPLPLLLRASGTVEVVGRPGTLLGVVPEPTLVEDEVLLLPGDALVLFTDGVTEASPLDDAFGPKQLAEFLRRCRSTDAGRIAASIERRVLEIQDGRPRDDVAVLVLRVPPGAASPFASMAQGVAARS
jgi:sigma-B regulation protein RsbU (phosphoserine phosphatase)